MPYSIVSSLRMLAALTLLTGVAYPLATWGIAQLAFPAAANGSLVVAGGKPIASSLIGQPFSDPRYFWSRPSATSPMPYNGAASSGSNQGPRNPALADAVRSRIEMLRAVDPSNGAAVPADLVTASASGLDPHISVAAARYQVGRVARATGLSRERVQALVDRHTELPLFGFIGEARVNVLMLNLDVDDARAH